MTGRLLIRTVVLLLGLWLASAAPAVAQSGGLATSASGGSSSESDGASKPADAWFRVDRLNAGLPPAPESLDRTTPMGAVESFLSAARAGRYDEAAHLLDLGRVPVKRQAERGPELARKLAAVIENHVWLDWDALPDRPDALVDGGAGGTPRAGERRRSLVVGKLDIGDHMVPLRLRRVKPEGAEPVWVFAPQSVDNIDALYDRYGPGWLHEWFPAEWQEKKWLSLQSWEFVALPVIVLLAVGIFLVLRMILGRLVAATPWRAASVAFRAARTPLALLGATVPLYWAMSSFITFSAPVTAILSPALIALMVLAVTLALLRGLDRLIQHFTRRLVGNPETEYDQHQRQLYTTIYAVRRIVLLLAFVVGLGVVLMQLQVFQAIGVSLLASAGVLTVILGIAAQPILGNILSSLQIALAKPIRIGDSVEYEGRWAYVESIFFTYVCLRTWDERRMIVPVQYFTSRPFENYSIVDKKMTRVFLLTLDPRTNVSELRDAYMEIARADEDVMQDEMLKVLVVDQNQAGIVIRFYCTAKDATTAWNMHCRLREQTLDWIRVHHPEWWPRQRELEERHDDDPHGSELRFNDAAE